MNVKFDPITPGERVTVVRRNPLRILRGRIDERGLVQIGDGTSGFTVKLEGFDGMFPYNTGDPRAAIHNIWSLDVERATEGLGWCRGWKGPEVEALKVANAIG